MPRQLFHFKTLSKNIPPHTRDAGGGLFLGKIMNVNPQGCKFILLVGGQRRHGRQNRARIRWLS
jgi:hypothetical protein